MLHVLSYSNVTHPVPCGGSGNPIPISQQTGLPGLVSWLREEHGLELRFSLLLSVLSNMLKYLQTLLLLLKPISYLPSKESGQHPLL